MQTQPTLPRLRTKLAFWLLLGMLSTALAEVTVASQVAPFFTVAGLLIAFPVYSLHILVLGHLVAVRNKPTVSLVWTAGILFGFYEFLITKVLWNPPWTTDPFRIAGVAIPELLVIGLFYHAFMAFLMPLWIGERSLTNSRSIPLPKRLARIFSGKGRWVAPALFGLVAGATAQERVGLSIASFALAAAGVLWWRRRGHTRWALIELLPDRREFRWLAGVLGICYLMATVAIRPEKLPGLLGWFSMLVLYAAVIFLFIRLERRQREDPDLPRTAQKLDVQIRPAIVATLVGLVAGVALPPTLGRLLMIVIIWGGGAVLGLVMLWGAARSARRPVPERT
ncbi:MAG: hypothetical protein GWP04_07525 [Gammaproteobacteria bacterium]|nr:hypothetical protein [Gammaproteobacteria bacterium]